MKIRLQSPAIFFLILGFFILSCGPASQVLETPANTDLPLASEESPVIVTPEATSTTTSPSHPGFYAPFGLLMNKDFGPPNKLDFGVCSYCDDIVIDEVDFSGDVCSLEQPFALTDPDGDFGVLEFTPTNAESGSVTISGGWVLERSSGGYTIEGNYTVEDSQTNASIPEGNLGLHITTPSSCFDAMKNGAQGCFPLDSWIYLTPLETTECGSP